MIAVRSLITSLGRRSIFAPIRSGQQRFFKATAQGSFYEWLGIDLIQAARNELSFIRLVDEHPNLYSGPVIKNAIRRYETLWLPLAFNEAEQKSKFKKIESSRILAAPLDIAWVWHVHMLAPHYYEKDCVNVVSKLVDHVPLNSGQRGEGLEEAMRVWKAMYPSEPFDVDLTEPPPVVTDYKSRVQYNLEEACYRQSKFFYQVSLPHYEDEEFLKKAVERYEHHLHLSTQNPEVFMVPCYDIDLIWHAHQLHPLNYKQKTTELLGKTFNHDDNATDRTPGSKLHDSEMRTRSVWETAGLRFAKPGAMYRGRPPDPAPLRPKWLYAPLARSEYLMEIQKIEAVNVEWNKRFVIELENMKEKVLFSQEFKGEKPLKNPEPKQFTFNNFNKHTLKLRLYRKMLFFKEIIAETEVTFLSCFQATPFDNAVARQPVTLSVPINRGKFIAAKVTVKTLHPSIIKYSFKVQPENLFTACNHPAAVLASPHLMLSPSDLAIPSLPCELSTHTVIDWRKEEVFKCRVVHCSSAMLSAVEIISIDNKVIASAHTVSPGTLPESISVQNRKKCVTLNQMEGERAMLIRGRSDWAICTGNWQQALNKHHFVKVMIYKLCDERGWCTVGKSKRGLLSIKLDSDTMVRLDLLQNKIVISPGAQDIPEILALALSVSILYLLCMPYTPELFKESSPSSQLSAFRKVSPVFYMAGFLSTTVPTNVYLKTRFGNDFCAAAPGDESEYPCYDLEKDFARDTNEGPECVSIAREYFDWIRPYLLHALLSAECVGRSWQGDRTGGSGCVGGCSGGGDGGGCGNGD